MCARVYVCACVCVCANQESSGGSIHPIYCGLLRVIGMDLYISTSRRRRRTVRGGGGDEGDYLLLTGFFFFFFFFFSLPPCLRNTSANRLCFCCFGAWNNGTEGWKLNWGFRWEAERGRRVEVRGWWGRWRWWWRWRWWGSSPLTLSLVDLFFSAQHAGNKARTLNVHSHRRSLASLTSREAAGG